MKYLLALALQGAAAPQPQAPPWAGGRVYTSASLHVGLRPAAYVDPGEVAVGFTLQLTAKVL